MISDEEWRHLQAPVLLELRSHGYDIDRLFDFGNKKTPSVKSIQILTQYLETCDSAILADALVRGLTCKEARGVSEEALIKAYRRFDGPSGREQSTRWAIGSAIGFVCGEKYYDLILPFVLDKSGGKARQMLVSWLPKAKKSHPEVVDVLIKCLKDDDLVLHAVGGLRLFKQFGSKSIPALRKVSNHNNREVARRAVKAIEAIEKFQEKL